MNDVHPIKVAALYRFVAFAEPAALQPLIQAECNARGIKGTILLAIELARDAALWNRPLNYSHLAFLYGVSFAACYLGHLAFRRMKPAFADVL